jgi:hypothetical protein
MNQTSLTSFYSNNNYPINKFGSSQSSKQAKLQNPFVILQE